MLWEASIAMLTLMCGMWAACAAVWASFKEGSKGKIVLFSTGIEERKAA